MIPRHATARLLRLLRGFPIVTVTGPRQSGKTTMVRGALPDLPYVSLEAPAQREFAQRASADFLRQYPNGAIIDEAQHAPELFSQLQQVVDEAQTMGMFVLTGSQNLSLMSRVSQSLAGRTALVELLPLSVAELRASSRLPSNYGTCLTQGFFPAIYSRPLQAFEWLHAYLVTYAERDARQLTAIHDLGAFQRLLRLSAARTGQVLNTQSLAVDVGISDKTARHWLSILETCYLIHFVRPHFANFGKRLIKSPKMYFTDVGLASALLGIQTAEQVMSHPLRGALFETLVVNELLKNRLNHGLHQPLYFWRDNTGTEVDVVLEQGQEIAAVEIKSSYSLASDAMASLLRWRGYAQSRGEFQTIRCGLVYGGAQRYVREGVEVLPWSQL